MRCFKCEKELEKSDDRGYDYQPYGGGTIQFSFGYGSTKYDCIVFRNQIRDPEFDDFVKKLLDGDPDVEWPKNKNGGILTTEPKEEMINSDQRDLQLASCSHIMGVICDDCFKKHCHLLKGYEQNEENNTLDEIVE